MSGLPEGARVLDVSYGARSHVGFTLRRALNAALAEGRLGPLSAKTDAEITERLLGLHTKYGCLAVVVRRVHDSWERVRDLAVNRDPALDQYVLDVGKVFQASELVTDVEGLLVTLHSTLDVAVGLAKLVERRVLHLRPNAQTSDKALRALPGISEGEQELFHVARGAFVHIHAPWLAVVLNRDAPADLAILTRRRPNYATGEGYVLLSRVDAVLTALRRHVDLLENSLAVRIGQLT